MNAALRKTEDVGDEGLIPDAQPWPWAGDPVADDLQGFDVPMHDDEASLQTKPGLSAAATEQQLANWIEAIVGHDDRALAALYDATFSRVFGLVQRIVRNAAMAEEVVEDAYFQVWRQAVRFDAARGWP